MNRTKHKYETLRVMSNDQGKTHKGKTQIIILLLDFFNCLAEYRERERVRMNRVTNV